MIERVQLPVPSLSEQQQIVRLLDEAFEGIAVAKANAEKNLQSTRTLFESQVQSVLSLGGERWEMKNVGEVCSFKRGLTYAKTDEVALSENVVLRATNIDLATNHLVYGELKYISDAVVVPEDKKVKKDSLIICMASGSKSHLGKVAIIEEDSGYAFGGFMGMLTPSVGLLPKYLFYLMTSGLYRTFIKSISDGANINNLTFDKLSSFSFPVPPLSEQKGIVAELDALEVSTGRLAATYAAKLRAIDALQASILSQAFSGNRKAA
jgi:type I restriction enzyme S subunit